MNHTPHNANPYADDLARQNVHPGSQELTQHDQDSAQLDRQIPVAFGDACVPWQPGAAKASQQRLVEHHVPPEGLEQGTGEETADLPVALRIDGARVRAVVAGHE